MVSRVDLGEITADVVFKDIKNVHLSVHPPNGRVRISAPRRMKLDNIRAFAISKLGWIKRQQTKLRAQERETDREYVDRESHYVWGKRYLLTVVERDQPPVVLKGNRRLHLYVRPATPESKKKIIIEEWYRHQLKSAIPDLLSLWEPRIGVEVNRFFVQRMKTKWGSCNPRAKTIRFNTELARKPATCLEYILVHEILHLIEPTHNKRFSLLMDRFMPDWEVRRRELNRLPIRRENWTY